jgi:DNA-binding protein Fis
MPTLEQLEDEYIHHVLEQVGHNQGKAAKVLGLSRRTVNRKLRDQQREMHEHFH